MDIRCMDGRSAKWLSAAGVDGYIRSSYGFQNPPGVACRILQGRISVDRSDSQEFQRRVMSS